MRVCSAWLATVLIANLAAAQTIESFGLSGQTVTAMTYYGGSLYAATANDGVYRRTLGALDSGWVHLGIPAKNLTSIFVFHTVCPLICWKGVLVGAQLQPAQKDTALIYFYQQRPDTCQKKGTWIAADSGMVRIRSVRVNTIGGIDVCHPIAPTYVTVFAATPGVIWRSEDRGKNWKEIWRDSSANILTFTAGAKQSFLNTDDEMWAGGYTVNNKGVRYPLMIRSTDSGLHWENRSGQAYAVSDECRALAVDPVNGNTVYAALQRDILKSLDGGKSWFNTTPLDHGHFYNAIAINPQRPQHILAGGKYSDLQFQFVLYESLDGGKNWNVPVGGSLKPVSSLVFDPFEARSVYLATLGNGVYHYRNLAVGVEEKQNVPQNFQLAANFPNPFRLHENATLVLQLTTPAADRVTFKLFNIAGQEIGVWKFGAVAGAQNFSVPLKSVNLNGGIYFMQAEWRGQRITRKLAVIR